MKTILFKIHFGDWKAYFDPLISGIIGICVKDMTIDFISIYNRFSETRFLESLEVWYALRRIFLSVRFFTAVCNVIFSVRIELQLHETILW